MATIKASKRHFSAPRGSMGIHPTHGIYDTPTWARQWERQRTYLFDYPSTDWQDFYRVCLGLGGVDPPTPAAAHA